MTNVRPFAVQFPGAKLLVEISPVRQWLRTPRARFLTQIGWIREHSRIWGLIAAQEQQLSLSDPVYKAICQLIAQPGKSLRSLVSSSMSMLRTLPRQAQVSTMALMSGISPGTREAAPPVVPNAVQRAATANPGQAMNGRQAVAPPTVQAPSITTLSICLSAPWVGCLLR